jgi:hypothetical protein
MTTLTFKVQDEEAQAIRRQAKAAGITVSELLRRRAIIPEKKNPAKTVLCEYSGIRIFAGDPSYIPLTNESVKEMLSDFP